MLIEPLRWSVDSLSALMSIAEDDYTIKLAVLHTLFNCLGIAIMLPLISQMASALEHWLPEIVVRTRVDCESMVARVTKLLGEKQIDAPMATSLLNDSSYASETVDAILTATRELLTATDVEAARTAEAMSVRDEGQAEAAI